MGPVEYYWGPITLRSSNSHSRNLLFLTLQGLDRKNPYYHYNHIGFQFILVPSYSIVSNLPFPVPIVNGLE